MANFKKTFKFVPCYVCKSWGIPACSGKTCEACHGLGRVPK